MSWTDLLLKMDVLFILPALLAAAILAGQAAYSATRLYRSSAGTGASGSMEATMPYGRRCGSTPISSNLKKVK